MRIVMMELSQMIYKDIEHRKGINQCLCETCPQIRTMSLLTNNLAMTEDDHVHLDTHIHLHIFHHISVETNTNGVYLHI